MATGVLPDEPDDELLELLLEDELLEELDDELLLEDELLDEEPLQDFSNAQALSLPGMLFVHQLALYADPWCCMMSPALA